MCWRDPWCLILEIWKILYYLNCNFGLVKVMFYKHCSYCVLVAFTCIISLITIPYCGGLVAQSCPILCDPMDCIPLGSSVWDFPGKNTGVGCHLLLQGNFVTQGSNWGLLHCRQILYWLNHHGSLYYYISGALFF